MKLRSYQDDHDRRRCLECDGFLAEGARVCKRCKHRREAAEAAEAAAEELAAAIPVYVPDRFRQGRLARYVQRALSVKGGERLAFFEQNPLSRIFD
jgi:hypothetical protein